MVSTNSLRDFRFAVCNNSNNLKVDICSMFSPLGIALSEISQYLLSWKPRIYFVTFKYNLLPSIYSENIHKSSLTMLIINYVTLRKGIVIIRNHDYNKIHIDNYLKGNS